VRGRDGQRLNVFQNRCLRRTLCVWWPDTISNAGLCCQTEVTGITVIIKVKKWRWTGHRLESSSDCHFTLNHTPIGKREVGALKRDGVEWLRKKEVPFGRVLG